MLAWLAMARLERTCRLRHLLLLSACGANRRVRSTPGASRRVAWLEHQCCPPFRER
jgi:hypothetical protein